MSAPEATRITWRKQAVNCFSVVWLLLSSVSVNAAGTGDPAPKKCSATDVEYTVSNVVPHGVCTSITDTILVDFNVNITGNPQRYNLTVGYTNAGDNILQDVSCLVTGIDLDNVGCDDYDGSGTTAVPMVTSSSFDVSCDLDGNLLVDPLVGVDFYVSFDASSGGTAIEITAPKCLVQTGSTFPLSPAKLVLNKTVINDNGGSAVASDWALTADLGSGTVTMTGPSGVVRGDLPAGDYVLSEAGPSGYIMDSIACKGGSFDAATSTVSLQPGDSAICNFTNNDDTVIPPSTTTLTLIKNVTNDSGGTALPDDFNLSIDGALVTSGIATSVISGTDLVISETDLPKYKAGAWECVDNNSLTSGLPANGPATGTTLNLAPGSDVVCTIVNDDQGVDLIVTKMVSDPSPNVGVNVEFEMLVENSGPDEATNLQISDIVPAGFSYVAGSITGGDTMIDTDPSNSGLQWVINSLPAGSAVTLSFFATVLTP